MALELKFWSRPCPLTRAYFPCPLCVYQSWISWIYILLRMHRVKGNTGSVPEITGVPMGQWGIPKKGIPRGLWASGLCAEFLHRQQEIIPLMVLIFVCAFCPFPLPPTCCGSSSEIGLLLERERVSPASTCTTRVAGSHPPLWLSPLPLENVPLSTSSVRGIAAAIAKSQDSWSVTPGRGLLGPFLPLCPNSSRFFYDDDPESPFRQAGLA